VSFEFRSEGSVRVNRSQVRRVEIPKRRTSMPKTTRGKSNVDTRLAEEIVGGKEKLTRWSVRM